RADALEDPVVRKRRSDHGSREVYTKTARRHLSAPPRVLHVRLSPGRLCLADVGRLQALRALDHFELQALALGQGLEALAGDGRVMHEHVLTAFLLDESETLRLVEPLHSTYRHTLLLANWGTRPLLADLATGPPGLIGRPPKGKTPPEKKKSRSPLLRGHHRPLGATYARQETARP